MTNTTTPETLAMIQDAITTIASMNREEVAAINDNDLDMLTDQVNYIVAVAKTEKANRQRQRDDQAIKDRETARRNMGQNINDTVNRVHALQEYGLLVNLAGLMKYAKKKNDMGFYAIQNKIEDMLDKHDLNEPRVIAHLVNMAS